ncbi:MAG: hypothetical protein HOM47_05715 [Euryarchaeota archaeon]|jgi:hypothetical protein|nr:hypothetical protein [Euryarchaeota archaeon]MBT5184651.1 hypothetical protein [Euryarchaeota archaeon]
MDKALISDSAKLNVKDSEDNQQVLYDFAIKHLQTEFDTSFEFVNEPILNKNGKRTLFVK